MNKSIKGLLKKDFQLMRAQMLFFVIIVFVWAALMMTSVSLSYFVGYVALIFSILTVSTFAYDEYENGCAYLFTLPISRKDYVREKYVFGTLIIILPVALLTFFSYVITVIMGGEVELLQYLMSIFMGLVMAFLILAIEIPVRIRFDSEKSRIVTIFIFAMVGASISILQYLNDLAEVDGIAVISAVTRLGDAALALLSVLILVVFLCASYKISCKFMEKKEF